MLQPCLNKGSRPSSKPGPTHTTARFRHRKAKPLHRKTAFPIKESLHRAVKDDHFGVLFSFQGGDDFVELRNSVRAKNVQGRVIKRDAPMRGRASRQKNLFRLRGRRWKSRARRETPLPRLSEFDSILGFHMFVQNSAHTDNSENSQQHGQQNSKTFTALRKGFEGIVRLLGCSPHENH